MTVEKNRCWYNINQHIRQKEFEAVEQEAAKVFLDFITGKTYGDGIGVYWFDLYVESKINFGRQTDGISSGCARLSAHIDKQIFDKADEGQKVKLLLNGALISLKYLSEKVPLPKHFQGERLVRDYKQFLKKGSLLLDDLELEAAITKPFETTRFTFVRSSTIEVDDDRILFDLNDIEDFINNGISGKTFGKSITAIHFGFELYDFNGQFASFFKQNEGLIRYGTKYKNFLFVKQFDYSKIKKLGKREQYALLKAKILEGRDSFDRLTRKPKDFDSMRFFNTLEKILTNYAEEKDGR